MTSVRIGFEAGTAEEVRVDLRHLGVTGLTQESGKTTLLEALMERSNGTAIAFRTSRGELGFHGAKRIAPFFRERTDWRFVEGLISAHLMERAKFYRGDLMRLTRGTQSLAQVHGNTMTALAKARSGSFQEKVYTELTEYLTEILDVLRETRFDKAPNLTPMALSVMDLEGLTPAVQQLVIAATVDWLMEGHLAVPVVVVLPEARDFIPEDRRTPAKLALENLIRKGARVDRYLWLDSQALTGLDMDVCRSIGTWFFGRQTLDLEVRRVKKMLPRNAYPNVPALRLGEFYMLQGEAVTKVYVQPAWMGEDLARRIARGDSSARDMATIRRTLNRKEENVDAEERKGYEDRIAELSKRVELLDGRATESATRVRELQGQLEDTKIKLRAEHDRAEANATKLRPMRAVVPADATPGKTVLEYDPLLGGGAERERTDLHVEHEVPNLTVHVKVVRIEVSTADLDGKIAKLIEEGFFSSPRRPAEVRAEFIARGWPRYQGGNSQVAFGRAFGRFAEWGFFRVLGDAYQVTPEAVGRIRVTAEPVTV